MNRRVSKVAEDLDLAILECYHVVEATACGILTTLQLITEVLISLFLAAIAVSRLLFGSAIAGLEFLVHLLSMAKKWTMASREWAVPNRLTSQLTEVEE